MSEEYKCKCDCGWRGMSSELLIADHPFMGNTKIEGCPFCADVGGFATACEVDGCWGDATCGAPWPDGVYRHTCGHHYRDNVLAPQNEKE